MFRIEQENGSKALFDRLKALTEQMTSGKTSVKVGVLKGATVVVDPQTYRIPKTIMKDIRKEARMRKAGKDTSDLRKRLMASIRNRKNWSRGVPKVNFSFSKRAKPKTISVAQYAFWNEFGTKRAPARPFMRNTLSNPEYRRGWSEVIRHGLEFGMSIEEIMQSVGHQMHLDMIQTIKTASSWAAPNAPLTAAIKRAKGRSHPDMPLVDEGNLIRSIWYEVIEK